MHEEKKKYIAIQMTVKMPCNVACCVYSHLNECLNKSRQLLLKGSINGHYKLNLILH